MKTQKHARRGRRGAALVEYGLIVGGVALVAVAAVAVFGRKTAQMIGVSAAALPGANAADNGPIATGSMIRTTEQDGYITIDPGQGNDIEANLGIDTGELIVDPSQGGTGGG
jgi:Flp pilus assembly pilin Flp